MTELPQLEIIYRMMEAFADSGRIHLTFNLFAPLDTYISKNSH